jgi:hypothetical protein
MGLILYFLWICTLNFYIWSVVMEARGFLSWGNVTWISPVILLAIYIIWLLMPLPILHRGSRYWLIRITLRGFCGMWNILFNCGKAPFLVVKFADFWLADQFTSMGYLLNNIHMVFCLYNPESSASKLQNAESLLRE